MLKVGTERRGRQARPGIRVPFKTAFLMTSEKVEAGDLPDRPKHRSSSSTVEEDFVAVMDSSAHAAIDALRSCDAISRAPRAAGYRDSDFVLWPCSAVRRLPYVRFALATEILSQVPRAGLDPCPFA